MSQADRTYPSQNTTNTWVWVKGPGKAYSQGKQTSGGKWLIYLSPDKVDAIWEIIREATVAKKLGIAAKVSTKKRLLDYGYKDYVICIYTRDFRDKDNVSLVLKALRELGIKGKLYYKTDQATQVGLYSKDSPLTKIKGSSSRYSSDDFE